MSIQRTEQPVSPKRVLLLGASGFLARNLSQALAAAGLDHRAIGSAQVDLTRPEATQQLEGLIRPDDSVVMLAALTPEKGKDPRTFTRNVLMTTHLCAALETSPCRQVVYVSSDAVYADQDGPITEETPICPKGLYALMHAAREAMLESTAASARIPLCVTRPCAVYGPGDTHNSYGPNRFVRSAHEAGKIELFGAGEEQRDHIYARDVSDFLVLCIRYTVQGVINITTGHAVSFLRLAELIAYLSPKPITIQTLPRRTAVTHRRFDPALRRKWFPSFEPAPLETGIKTMMEDVFAPKS